MISPYSLIFKKFAIYLRDRSHLKNWILVQAQGGAALQSAGVLKYVEDLKRDPNKEIGPKDFLEIASAFIKGIGGRLSTPGVFQSVDTLSRVDQMQYEEVFINIRLPPRHNRLRSNFLDMQDPSLYLQIFKKQVLVSSVMREALAPWDEDSATIEPAQPGRRNPGRRGKGKPR